MSINQPRNDEKIEIPQGYSLWTIESITPIGNGMLRVKFEGGSGVGINSTTFSDRGIDFTKIKQGDKVLLSFTHQGYKVTDVRLVDSC